MLDLLRVVGRIALAGAVAFGLAVGLLGPFVEDQAEVSVVAVVTVIGAALAFEIIRAARRSGRLAWERSIPIWARARRGTAARQPDGVAEWEALLVAARPAEPRARDRLLRRMESLAWHADPAILASIRTAEPDEFEGLVRRFVEEAGQQVD